MKLHALMNRLEDIGEDRDVLVIITPDGFTRTYEVNGAQPDMLDAHEDGATVQLLLRERSATAIPTADGDGHALIFKPDGTHHPA